MSKSYSEDFIGKIFPLVAPITSNGFMNYKALRVLKDYPFDRDEVDKLVGKTVSPISTNDIFGTKKYCIIDPDRKYGALYDVGTTENGIISYHKKLKTDYGYSYEQSDLSSDDVPIYNIY